MTADEKIVQICVDGWDTGNALFCLTDKGRIFVRSVNASSKPVWDLLKLPTEGKYNVEQ